MRTEEALRILGLTPRSTQEEARQAYRTRALEKHPDQGGSHLQMVKLNEAMEVVRELSLPLEYDTPPSSTRQPETREDLRDLFSDLFGGYRRDSPPPPSYRRKVYRAPTPGPEPGLPHGVWFRAGYTVKGKPIWGVAYPPGHVGETVRVTRKNGQVGHVTLGRVVQMTDDGYAVYEKARAPPRPKKPRMTVDQMRYQSAHGYA